MKIQKGLKALHGSVLKTPLHYAEFLGEHILRNRFKTSLMIKNNYKALLEKS